MNLKFCPLPVAAGRGLSKARFQPFNAWTKGTHQLW